MCTYQPSAKFFIVIQMHKITRFYTNYASRENINIQTGRYGDINYRKWGKNNKMLKVSKGMKKMQWRSIITVHYIKLMKAHCGKASPDVMALLVKGCEF